MLTLRGLQLLESKIQKDLIKYLRLRMWMVKHTNGNAFQDGFPDLYATHSMYGIRWIEVKKPLMKGSVWTTAQKRDFPQLMVNGTNIWVLTGATHEEYIKLFEACNLWDYMDVTQKDFKRRR